MRPDVCIFHSPCADGFAAAWVVWKKFGNDVEFLPGVYGQPAHDVAYKNVLIVDFSYKRPVFESLLQSGDVRQAHTICILDHHKTAAADLAGLKKPGVGGYEPDHWRADWEQIGEWPVRAVFDMERSGAQITWDFFNPGQPRPWLIDYVGDRDLWQFKLPGSREVAAVLFSHSYDFATWDALATKLDDPEQRARIIQEGEAIERKHHKDVAELLAQTRRTMKIGGVVVPVANIPYTMASDAAGKMAEEAPFAACYFDRPDARVFSLRSRGEQGADVSEIAKRYGGGGHKNAAGFQMPLGWEGE